MMRERCNRGSRSEESRKKVTTVIHEVGTMESVVDVMHVTCILESAMHAL